MKKNVSCNPLTARKLIYKKKVRFNLNERSNDKFLYTLKRFEYPFKSSLNPLNNDARTHINKDVFSNIKLKESENKVDIVKKSQKPGLFPKSQIRHNSMTNLNYSKMIEHSKYCELKINIDNGDSKNLEDKTSKVCTSRPKMLKNKFNLLVPKYYDPASIELLSTKFRNLDKIDRKVLLSKIKQELNDNINCVNRKTLKIIDPAFTRSSAVMTPLLTPNKNNVGCYPKTPDKRRFRSLVQRPLFIQFLNKRISEKLSHMCFDSVEIDKNVYEEFICKLTQNFFKKKPNIEVELVDN